MQHGAGSHADTWLGKKADGKLAIETGLARAGTSLHAELLSRRSMRVPSRPHQRMPGISSSTNSLPPYQSTLHQAPRTSKAEAERFANRKQHLLVLAGAQGQQRCHRGLQHAIRATAWRLGCCSFCRCTCCVTGRLHCCGRPSSGSSTSGSRDRLPREAKAEVSQRGGRFFYHLCKSRRRPWRL